MHIREDQHQNLMDTFKRVRCAVTIIIPLNIAIIILFTQCTDVGLPAMAATYTGTCASIGYTTQCCPPDEDCTAADNIAGTEACYCSSDCYIYEDCCSDIVSVCPESK